MWEGEYWSYADEEIRDKNEGAHLEEMIDYECVSFVKVSRRRLLNL